MNDNAVPKHFKVPEPKPKPKPKSAPKPKAATGLRMAMRKNRPLVPQHFLVGK